MLINNALANDPALARDYQSLGYTFDYTNNQQLTDLSFRPAPAQIILDGGGKITIRTVSMESVSGLPVGGGMNHCKLIDPTGLPELFADIKAGNFDYLTLGSAVSPVELVGSDLRTAEVTYDGILGDLLAQEATLIYQPGATFKGTYVSAREPAFRR